MNCEVRGPTAMLDSKAALIALTLLACSDSNTGTDASAPLDSAITTRLQQHVDALHAGGVVGVVGEVDDHGTRFQARAGVAQVDGNQPAPLDGHYRIGSTTKTFVAVVVL